jgi:hypothetical protein
MKMKRTILKATVNWWSGEVSPVKLWHLAFDSIVDAVGLLSFSWPHRYSGPILGTVWWLAQRVVDCRQAPLTLIRSLVDA